MNRSTSTVNSAHGTLNRATRSGLRTVLRLRVSDAAGQEGRTPDPLSLSTVV